MAKITVDLDTLQCVCRACGLSQQEPMPNPCPRCGVRFHAIEYRRGDVRYLAQLLPYQMENVESIDSRTHLMISLAHLWTHQARVYVTGGYSADYIDKKKHEFYADKLSKFERSRQKGGLS